MDYPRINDPVITSSHQLARVSGCWPRPDGTAEVVVQYTDGVIAFLGLNEVEPVNADYDYRFDTNVYPFPSSEVFPAIRKPQPIVLAKPPRIYAVNLSKLRMLIKRDHVRKVLRKVQRMMVLVPKVIYFLTVDAGLKTIGKGVALVSREIGHEVTVKPEMPKTAAASLPRERAPWKSSAVIAGRATPLPGYAEAMAKLHGGL